MTSAASLSRSLVEIRLLAGRSLRHIPRIPEKAVVTVPMPLVFVVLFAYVFGSVIRAPGGDYHAYLVSGIFAQSMLATLPGIAVGVAGDLKTGLIDRLRTMPVSRLAVLGGRTIAEMVELLAGMIIVALCGLAIGWAPHGSPLEALAAFGIVLLAGFAVVWAGMLAGQLVRDPEAVDSLMMALFFPLMFLSAVFVPVASLPTPLRQIAEYNPLSAVATAVRRLFDNPIGAITDAWPLQHPIVASLLWCAPLIGVFAPLAIRRFQHMNR
jgi:ABC transporter DrrB family efflux protein